MNHAVSWRVSETVRLLNGSGDNATQTMRAAELFCRIAVESKAGFDHCVTGGQLEAVVQLWHQSDILVRLNALEVIAELCGAKHCFEWLEGRGVLAEMMQVLGASDSIDSAYMIPAILRATSKILVHSNNAAEALLDGGLLRVLVQLAAGQGGESELALLILGMCCIARLEAVLGVVRLDGLLADKLVVSGCFCTSPYMCGAR